MKFLTREAPFWHGADSVSRLMMRVNLALIPVVVTSTMFFGYGVLINLLFAGMLCMLLEALLLILRKRPVRPFLLDGSAVITAALIVLAMPPTVPWWVTATACLFAIVFAKHLYGGLGYNVFNPAMVGYVVALIAFPQHLALWPTPANGHDLPTALQAFLVGAIASSPDIDAVTSATPLDTIKIQLNQMRMLSEIIVAPVFGKLAGRGWEWINLITLAAGCWLLYKKVISWHIPLAFLGTLGGLYLLFFFSDAAIYVSPVVGLLSGGTMLGAFFVATDPVSAASSKRGKLIYGAGIGILSFIIRQWGAYPDGIAFAVLIMNMAVPLIDRYTLPRVYGRPA